MHSPRLASDDRRSRAHEGGSESRKFDQRRTRQRVHRRRRVVAAQRPVEVDGGVDLLAAQEAREVDAVQELRRTVMRGREGGRGGIKRGPKSVRLSKLLEERHDELNFFLQNLSSSCLSPNSIYVIYLQSIDFNLALSTIYNYIYLHMCGELRIRRLALNSAPAIYTNAAPM